MKHVRGRWCTYDENVEVCFRSPLNVLDRIPRQAEGVGSREQPALSSCEGHAPVSASSYLYPIGANAGTADRTGDVDRLGACASSDSPFNISL